MKILFKQRWFGLFQRRGLLLLRVASRFPLTVLRPNPIVSLSITFCCFMAAMLFPCALHANEQECDSKASLSKLEGHYARDTVWEQLPKLRIWKDANRYKGWISAVDIMPDGTVDASFGWHEAGSICAKFKGGILWAKSYSSSDKWEGPFLRVGSSSQNSWVAYFNRLFGSKCYSASNGDTWCFGTGSIKINERIYQAKLVLDRMEMPSYGSPVKIENEKNFWVFVPYGSGWKVFQDTYVTEEGHEDVDPATSKPWQVLRPK